MKFFWITLFFPFVLLANDATNCSEGEGSDVASCIENAVNNALINSEYTDNQQNISPIQVIGIKYFKNTTQSGASFYRSSSSVPEAETIKGKEGSKSFFQELNYTLSEAEVAQGKVLDSTSWWSSGDGHNIHRVTKMEAPIFEFKSTQLYGSAKVASLKRSYTIDGKIQHVECSLKNLALFSNKTKALLLRTKD